MWWLVPLDSRHSHHTTIRSDRLTLTDLKIPSDGHYGARTPILNISWCSLFSFSLGNVFIHLDNCHDRRRRLFNAYPWLSDHTVPLFLPPRDPYWSTKCIVLLNRNSTLINFHLRSNIPASIDCCCNMDPWTVRTEKERRGGKAAKHNDYWKRQPWICK